jgi:hypothetical protein
MPSPALILLRDLEPCAIFELRCPKCGPVRLAIPRSGDEAPTELSCPYCSAAAPAWPLGTGQTRRPLPYFDHVPNNIEIDQRAMLCENGFLLKAGSEFLRVDRQLGLGA